MAASLVVESSRVPSRITGSPLQWSRDLAWVSAVTGFVAPAAALGTHGIVFASVAALTGLGCGLLLGQEMPQFLDSARHRMSLWGIALRCTAVGAALGAFVGLVSAHVTGQMFLGPFWVAGVAGALQLGWMWLPYTVLTVMRRPTWPVVVVACAVAPALGPLALFLSRLLAELLL